MRSKKTSFNASMSLRKSLIPGISSHRFTKFSAYIRSFANVNQFHQLVCLVGLTSIGTRRLYRRSYQAELLALVVLRMADENTTRTLFVGYLPLIYPEIHGSPTFAIRNSKADT